MAPTISQNKETINWVSLVRLVAIFTVIASHMADHVPMIERTSALYKSWVPYYGSFLRPCVPLFIMLTGFLLLPKMTTERKETTDLLAFYKKRIPRVAIPFIIWTIIFNLFPWFLVTLLGLAPATINIFFPFVEVQTLDMSFINGLKSALINLPLNFTSFNTHMWYVYAIIGIYLYLPIFSAWVEKASNRSKLVFLTIWGGTLLVPYLREINPITYPEAHYLMGACSWNEFSLFYYFAGLNGYLLLGHYLGNLKNLDSKKVFFSCIPLFLIGYFITVKGFSYMLNKEGATEAQIELFYTYCTPNVVLMSLSSFLMLKQLGERFFSQKKYPLLDNINICAFGIYLIHYIFLGPIHHMVQNWDMPSAIKMTIASVISFGLCWIFVALIKKLKYSKWLLG